MVKIPSAIEESVQRFLDAVSKLYRIQAAYLYGSQAKGITTFLSDIDVAVISPDFSQDLFEERLALMHLAADIDDRIEPYPFTTETFNESHPVASEIQQHGLQIV